MLHDKTFFIFCKCNIMCCRRVGLKKCSWPFADTCSTFAILDCVDNMGSGWSEKEAQPYLLLCVFTLKITFLGMFYLPRFVSTEESGLFDNVYYKYDRTTLFDNTYLTWATDYGLAFLTSAFALQIAMSCDKSSLRDCCVFLLICYAISVTTGGICHQFFYSPTDLNTGAFRLLWTICVGFVTMAGAFIGNIGSKICELIHHSRGQRLIRFKMFLI